MSYFVVKIKVEKDQYDLLTGLLSLMDFEAVEEKDEIYLAYFEMDEVTDDFIAGIDRIKAIVPFEYSIEKVEEKNWNAEWEANFTPIVLDDFVAIRADFHPENRDVEFDLIINPKMAFGTGHHETTEMMMRFMKLIDFKDKSVFDFGCGTGVLAILAKKLECGDCLAIDYDINSVTNTQENIEINQTPNIRVKQGSLEEAYGEKYDVVLANINRSVLTKYAHQFSEIMNIDAKLMISGFLRTEIEMMTEMFESQGFEKIDLQEKGEWACMLLKRL